MTRDTPIRPIRTPEDHAAALAEIDRLFDAPAGSAARDRLEVLAVLVAAYERDAHPLTPPDPIDVLTFAMKAQGRTQSDLAELFGSRSRASEVLNRRRHLSADMVVKLSEAWSLPTHLLSAPYAVTSAAAGGVKRAVVRGAAALVVAVMIVTGGIGTVFWRYGRDLPGTADLAAYTPPDVTRYADDGRLVEFRRFVPLADIPPHVIKAFLAAEDRDYLAHGGYSVAAILRAGAHNIANAGSERKPAGGATITQQLAKNLFLVGQEPSIDRKIKELILARRIEESLSKERILELYLNQIYFGGSAWGIAAAAQHYFVKTPSELSVAEAAYLAALPKAPNHYRLDIAENRPRARERRDWVLARMADDGLITATAAEFARTEPLDGTRR